MYVEEGHLSNTINWKNKMWRSTVTYQRRSWVESTSFESCLNMSLSPDHVSSPLLTAVRKWSLYHPNLFRKHGSSDQLTVSPYNHLHLDSLKKQQNTSFFVFLERNSIQKPGMCYTVSLISRPLHQKHVWGTKTKIFNTYGANFQWKSEYSKVLNSPT